MRPGAESKQSVADVGGARRARQLDQQTARPIAYVLAGCRESRKTRPKLCRRGVAGKCDRFRRGRDHPVSALVWVIHLRRVVEDAHLGQRIVALPALEAM